MKIYTERLSIAFSFLDASTMDREALVQAILDLENNRAGKVEDPNLAYELAHHVKPRIDQLSALAQGLPVEEDEEEVTISSLAAEAELAEVEGVKPRRKRAVRKKPSSEGPLPELASLPPQDKARWVFMERFIPLEQHEDILGYSFTPEDFSQYEQALGSFLVNLLLLPDAILAAQNSDILSLQKIFASLMLIFRNPFIGDGNGNPIACTVENLRQHHPSFFYKRRKKPNWFESYNFYAEPLGQAHWVLCEIDYLNCTLRGPKRKLAGFAKRWHIPPENVRQKTVLEDIYDRIICGEALGEHLFEQNCNCCTATTYRSRNKGPSRMVYTVQRHQKISIHGKVGIPHWRTSRRLWPGIFPSIVFP